MKNLCEGDFVNTANISAVNLLLLFYIPAGLFSLSKRNSEGLGNGTGENVVSKPGVLRFYMWNKGKVQARRVEPDKNQATFMPVRNNARKS